MFNEVQLELRMNFLVSNAFITLNVCHKSISLFLWHLYGRIIHSINLFIIRVYHFIFISLIFNNYVMENHICFHDLLEYFKMEKSCRSTNNCETCLKHSKCTLNILTTFYMPLGLLQIIFVSVLTELGLFSQMLPTLHICHQ